ncbi:MAG: esterase [Methylibium sp. NZG]|nr:MAG: esterase [Methylibium sp. NZG]
MDLRSPTTLLATGAALLLAACAQTGALPRLSAASGTSLQACAELATRVKLPQTVIASAATVPAGTLAVAGQPIPEHCLVVGRMNERTSAVDGQAYAIGFQMRLPRDWNGRFYHQGNGGLDGFVANALGPVGGGGELTNALLQGFAVLSSDAGHTARQLPLFGRDPQARLDYGYAAVGTLTPMARDVIKAAYGKAPDRSYFGGCSNGGRHAMVAASRYAADYDGILAGNPGFNLPKAAVAQLYGAQQFATLAGDGDLASSFAPDERRLVAERVRARCDALDGLADGMVHDTVACRTAFNLERDVPTCTGPRVGTCLSAAQKSMLTRIFTGPNGADGAKLYSSFPFDPGIAASDWASWKFVSSITNRDPVAVAYVFQTPPAAPGVTADPRAFAMAFDVLRDGPKIFARDATYTESSMEFMTPPNVDDFGALKRRGAKMVVYHGVADGVFSSDDTAAWYGRLQATHGGDASNFARLFLVPGMNHCRGGPSADQFDMLTPLVEWVERGRPPERVVARARGAGHPVPNVDLPEGWPAARTRPLCPYPSVARYDGSGNTERAESFECR